MYCHCVSPTRIPAGDVRAIARPTTATAPAVRINNVARDGSILRILDTMGTCASIPTPWRGDGSKTPLTVACVLYGDVCTAATFALASLTAGRPRIPAPLRISSHAQGLYRTPPPRHRLRACPTHSPRRGRG